MAKIDRVKIQVGRTISTGNYENIKVDYGVEAVVSDHEDIMHVTDQLTDDAIEGLDQVARALRGAK